MGMIFPERNALRQLVFVDIGKLLRGYYICKRDIVLYDVSFEIRILLRIFADDFLFHDDYRNNGNYCVG